METVDFFIPVQNELFSKVEDGELTLNEFICYVWIIRQCNYETGLWRGSVPKLEAALGGQLSDKSIQIALKRLCERGLLKSFHMKGKRSNYWVAIHNYPVRFGEKKNFWLNALATENPENPIYYKKPTSAEWVADDPPMDDAVQKMDGEGGTEGESTGKPEGIDRESTGKDEGKNLRCIPDSSRSFQTYPDGPYSPDLSNQPAPACPDNGQPTFKLSSWLVGRIESHLQNFGIMELTARERVRVEKQERLWGSLLVLLGFLNFLTQRKLKGLEYPISVFLNEQWIEKAHKNALEEDCGAVDEDIRAICEKHSYPTDRLSLSLLSALRIKEAVARGIKGREFFSVGLAAVEEFLKSNPVLAQVVTEKPVEGADYPKPALSLSGLAAG